MNIKYLLNRAKRLKDKKYLHAYVKIKKDTYRIKKLLVKLKNYHNGVIFDFSNERDNLLIEIIKYSYKNSLYYKNIFDILHIDINNINSIKKLWEKIPLLDKKIIRKEGGYILALPSTKEYIGYMTTGGSTGQPLGFHTFGSHDSEHQKFLYELMGYVPGDKILALDGTLVPQDKLLKNIYWVKKSDSDLPYGSVALSSHYLNSETISHYINFLNNFKPTIIRGYPSFIESIAKHIKINNIALTFKPKGIELTSETFYDYQTKLISEAFDTKIYSQYGHAEASVFGYTFDPTMMIYCSPFYGYTEIIGENGKHVSIGEIGEVIVTGFNNHALPFIRYKTGDLALYAGEENGIVKLSQIYGRTQDVIYTSELEEIRLTALVFGRHYKAFNNIEKWQIIQNTAGEVTLKIIKYDSFSIEDESEIRENFQDIGKIITNFEFVDSIHNTKRGKSKLLIQNITKN